jgi:hypothetical protein
MSSDKIPRDHAGELADCFAMYAPGLYGSACVLTRGARALAEDPEDSGVVWLALAVSQWRTGRIVGDVLSRAIEIINSGADLRRWEQQPKLRQARARVLEKTREQLMSQPPEPRRIPRPHRSETPFEPGDVLLYRHRSGREFVFWVTGNSSDKGRVQHDRGARPRRRGSSASYGAAPASGRPVWRAAARYPAADGANRADAD